MKLKRLFITLLSAAALTLGSYAADPVKSCDKLPMSMYIWQGCMADSDFVDRINFGNFDMVYLMDKSLWNSQAEFDRDIDSIIADRHRIIPLTKRDLFRLAVDNAHAANTLALLSVGNDLLFSSLDDERMNKSADALCQTVEQLDLDGLDIDWEIDVWRHFDRHALLMATLRSKLDSLSAVTGKIYKLSTALSAEAKYPDKWRNTLARAVDHVNLMSYDLGGCLWRDYASHNTPLAIIEHDINDCWYDIPREKLHLGLASYGFMYNGILPDERVPQGKTIGDYGRFVDYKNMLPYMYGQTAWRRQYDPVDHMNYFIDDNGHSFITMETPETIADKFDYAVDAGLGGTFWWEYAKDIVPDNNGSPYWHHILVPDHKYVGTHPGASNLKNHKKSNNNE